MLYICIINVFGLWNNKALKNPLNVTYSHHSSVMLVLVFMPLRAVASKVKHHFSVLSIFEQETICIASLHLAE